MRAEWRPAPGFPGYEVPSEGQVRRADTGRVRALARSPKGYVIVNIGRTVSVHRLVARAFHGEPGAGEQARHLDGNPTNNRASNLAWGSAVENAADKVGHGTAFNSHKNQTHCKNGHPLSGDNLRMGRRSDGGRVRLCVTCRRESQRRYDDVRRAA